MLDLCRIGKVCHDFRQRELKVTVKEVANVIGYSKAHITNFEHGRVNNLIIFLWYVSKGLDVRKVL